METTYFERFIFELTAEEARSASYPGPCDEEVAALLEVPHIKEQLSRISWEDMAEELAGYGAWDAEELAVPHDNEARIVWIAAGNIAEELAEREG